MKTKKQQELIELYLSQLVGEEQTIYRELIVYLSELGYNPKKEGLRISFKHDLHSKQIAKIGMSRGKQPRPIFMLRFSACQDYSRRFKEQQSAKIILTNLGVYIIIVIGVPEMLNHMFILASRLTAL